MKAKTIEELREEFCEIYKIEYIPLMSNILFQYVQHLEQKLIQPEPQRGVEEEDIWNKKDLEKVKDYILTESAKQTEEQKKHIIDFGNRLSEQVTEGIGFDDLGLDEIDNLILHWLNSRSENITQLSFDIVQYFKGLSLQNK